MILTLCYGMGLGGFMSLRHFEIAFVWRLKVG